MNTGRTLGERVKGFVMEAISPKWRMAAIGLVIVLILMLTGCTSSADRAVAAAEAVSEQSSSGHMFSEFGDVARTLLTKAVYGTGAILLFGAGVLFMQIKPIRVAVFGNADEMGRFNYQMQKYIPGKPKLSGLLENMARAKAGLEPLVVKDEKVDLEVLVKLGEVHGKYAIANSVKYAGLFIAMGIVFAWG